MGSGIDWVEGPTLDFGGMEKAKGSSGSSFRERAAKDGEVYSKRSFSLP